MVDQPKEEKLEFLKREEIKTMAKDLARLREEEARKERERIIRLKTEQEARRERERLERIRKEAEERKRAEEERKRAEMLKRIEEERKKEALAKAKPSVLPPPAPTKVLKIPKPPTLVEKILIRAILIILLLLLIAFIITFWYWYLIIKEAKPIFPPKEIEEIEKIPPPEKPEVIIPPPLIPVQRSLTLEISTLNQLPSLFSSVLEKELPQNQLSEVVIVNSLENKVLGLKDFFEAFEIKPPENFYDKIENDFTLLIYSQPEGKRLAFLAKIREKENLKGLLISWESTLEKDFENLFTLMNKEKPALVPYFKDGSYRKISFRYQTFTREDLGICYLTIENYFVFASSWESITKILDKIIEK